MTNKNLRKELSELFNLKVNNIKVVHDFTFKDIENYNFTLSLPNTYCKGRAVVQNHGTAGNSLLSANILERIAL